MLFQLHFLTHPVQVKRTVFQSIDLELCQTVLEMKHAFEFLSNLFVLGLDRISDTDVKWTFL